jgi:hypothetical protein
MGRLKIKKKDFLFKKKTLLSFLWGFFFDKKEGPRQRASFFTKPFFLDMDEICHVPKRSDNYFDPTK